jgi:hypothetical protein
MLILFSSILLPVAELIQKENVISSNNSTSKQEHSFASSIESFKFIISYPAVVSNAKDNYMNIVLSTNIQFIYKPYSSISVFFSSEEIV